jgi:hypothetical protein
VIGMATHATLGSRRYANIPNPIASASPLLALAVVALALDAAPDLPWEAGVAVALLFAAAAAVRLVQKWFAVRRLRAVADRVILRGGDLSSTSPLILWRTTELTSRRHRRAIAAEAARLARELDASMLPGAVPLNRAAVRPYRQELEALAALLGGPEPISARGVLLAQQLLSSPASPLYDRSEATMLEPRLRRVFSTLRA